MARKSEAAASGQGELAPRPGSAVALPADLLAEDAGEGLEDVRQENLAVPFLAIIQSNSPQVAEMGLRPGVLFNNVTAEVFEDAEGIVVVPCHFREEYVEWRLREKGGGFVAVHSPEDAQALLAECTRDEKNRDIRPGGETHLVRTANHYVLLDDGGGQFAVIAMSSTQLKKSRKWLSAIAMRKETLPDGRKFQPPMFATRYRLRTKPESNEKGKWFGWQIEPEGPVTDRDTYESAKSFHRLVHEGRVTPTDKRPEAEEPDGEGGAERAA